MQRLPPLARCERLRAAERRAQTECYLHLTPSCQPTQREGPTLPEPTPVNPAEEVSALDNLHSQI